MALVETRVAEGVRTITLNRPERRNAINADLQAALVAALGAFDADPEARVAVLTGADPAFCAGMDLRELGAGRLQFSDEPTYADAMRSCRKPVIGAINGPAVAGGFELALACDFLIASERAYFADTHARVGVLPGGGLTVLLAQAVGVRRARRLSLTGEYVDAERALRDGLVTEVVPHDQLLTRAEAVAATIASPEPDMVTGLRLAYERSLNLPADEALDAEAAASRRAGIPADTVRDVSDGLVTRGSAFVEGGGP
jgi:enoyl-CoA hydratase